MGHRRPEFNPPAPRRNVSHDRLILEVKSPCPRRRLRPACHTPLRINAAVMRFIRPPPRPPPGSAGDLVAGSLDVSSRNNLHLISIRIRKAHRPSRRSDRPNAAFQQSAPRGLRLEILHPNTQIFEARPLTRRQLKHRGAVSERSARRFANAAQFPLQITHRRSPPLSRHPKSASKRASAPQPQMPV